LLGPPASQERKDWGNEHARGDLEVRRTMLAEIYHHIPKF
jgi:hypothetical protein